MCDLFLMQSVTVCDLKKLESELFFEVTLLVLGCSTADFISLHAWSVLMHVACSRDD